MTGITHFPPTSATAPPFCPLMVGIHGGSCTAHQLRRRLKAHRLSRFRLPRHPLRRPLIARTTKTRLPFCLDRRNDLFAEEGIWEHELIFPALWEPLGKPNGCTGIVAIRHSMAVAGVIIAASLYSQVVTPTSPLRGLVFSGYGTQRIDRMKELVPHPGTPSSGQRHRFRA